MIHTGQLSRLPAAMGGGTRDLRSAFVVPAEVQPDIISKGNDRSGDT